MYSRRDFLRVSSLLGGGVVLSTALTGRATAAQPETLSAATFAHGVASGDPLSDGVMLWTRATPERAAPAGAGLGTVGRRELWPRTAQRHGAGRGLP